MRPPNNPAQLQEGPLTLAQHLLSTAASPLVHVALGLLLGVVLARTARRSRIHWGWGLLALMVAAVLRPSLGGGGPTRLPATHPPPLPPRPRHPGKPPPGGGPAAAGQPRRSP